MVLGLKYLTSINWSDFDHANISKMPATNDKVFTIVFMMFWILIKYKFV